MASVAQAGRRTFSNAANLTFKGEAGQPAGLGNWDNSCYQNSILQGLAALKPFPRYLSGLMLEGPSANDKTVTTGALRELIADLNDASNNGRTLWTPSILKNMSTSQQQDAQEYFSKLLDEIDKEIARAAKATHRPFGFETDLNKDDTASSQHSDDSGYQSLSTISKCGSELRTIRNPLEGFLAQRVACTACEFSEGLSLIPFNCLTLNFDIGIPQYDLYELLDNYVRLEPIPNVECTKCTLLDYRKRLQALNNTSLIVRDRLETVEAAIEEDDFDEKTLKSCNIPKKKVESTKTKQAVIARPPQSLVIHMNRSVFDETTFRTFKNMAAVRFPSMLDLGPWTLGSAGGRNPGASAYDNGEGSVGQTAPDEEKWACSPTASMVAGDTYPSKLMGPFYELRAVVTHYGRHENGHYVCYRKHSKATKMERASNESPILPESRPTYDVGGDDASTLVDDDQFVEAEEVQEKDDTQKSQQGDRYEPESQWWRLSDQDVTEVSEEFVLAQGGVFMLFYDCVDPNAVLISQIQNTKEESLAFVGGGYSELANTDNGVAEPKVLGTYDSIASIPIYNGVWSGLLGKNDADVESSSAVVEDDCQSALVDKDDTPARSAEPQEDPPLPPPPAADILTRAQAVSLPDEGDDEDI